MKKLVMMATILSLFIASIILSSCGGNNDDESAATDTTTPKVTATTPSTDEINVAANAAVSATFSEVMDASTITPAIFTLDGVAGSVTYAGTTATFTPSTNLAYSTTYTATITAAVKDLAGNTMTSDYTWSFSTGQEPDALTPTVSVAKPVNNSMNVFVDATVSAIFSEVMDASTITTANFTLNGVAGTVTYAGTTATFTPATSLAFSTTYTATVKAAVKDLAGNAMTSDYTWSFTTVAAKGVRLLGMDVLNNTPTIPFVAGVTKAKAAGVQFITFPVLWSQLTPTGPTSYDPTWVQNIKAMAAVCSANDLMLSLTFWTVDATGKHLPTDLMTTRFTDPSHAMANRFVAILDHLFITEGIDHTLLTSVQIGNELDGYNVAADPDFSWSDYGAFLFKVRELMDSKLYAAVPIGFTGTLYGLNDQKAVFTAIAGAVDIVGANYYPLNMDFSVKDPSVVDLDIAALISNYSAVGKPFSLQEVGYPSSAQCNSSEEKQTQFVQNLFVAWDTYSTQITAVNFLRLNDVSMASAEATAVQYGVPDNAGFIEYIRTLGFVAYDGTEKQAFQALSDNAHARGW